MSAKRSPPRARKAIKLPVRPQTNRYRLKSSRSTPSAKVRRLLESPRRVAQRSAGSTYRSESRPSNGREVGVSSVRCQQPFSSFNCSGRSHRESLRHSAVNRCQRDKLPASLCRSVLRNTVRFTRADIRADSEDTQVNAIDIAQAAGSGRHVQDGGWVNRSSELHLSNEDAQRSADRLARPTWAVAACPGDSRKRDRRSVIQFSSVSEATAKSGGASVRAGNKAAGQDQTESHYVRAARCSSTASPSARYGVAGRQLQGENAARGAEVIRRRARSTCLTRQ